MLAYDRSSGAPDSLGHISLRSIDPCIFVVAGLWPRSRCTRESWANHCDRSITAHSSIPFVNSNRLGDIEHLCLNMRHWLTNFWQSRSLCRHFIEVLAHLWSTSQRVRCWDTAQVLLAKLQHSLQGMSWPMIDVQDNWDLPIQSRMSCLDIYKVNFDKLRLIMDISSQPRHASRATNKPPMRMYPSS